MCSWDVVKDSNLTVNSVLSVHRGRWSRGRSAHPRKQKNIWIGRALSGHQVGDTVWMPLFFRVDSRMDLYHAFTQVITIQFCACVGAQHIMMDITRLLCSSYSLVTPNPNPFMHKTDLWARTDWIHGLSDDKRFHSPIVSLKNIHSVRNRADTQAPLHL